MWALLLCGYHVLLTSDASLHSCEAAPGALVSQVWVTSAFSNNCFSRFSGVESQKIRFNWWRPSRINEARKAGQPRSLASQEAISRGGRVRAVCDVHAWTWGFRVMVCVYPDATPHKLRTSLSDPETGPTATERRRLQRIDSTSQMLHMGVTIRTCHLRRP